MYLLQMDRYYVSYIIDIGRISCQTHAESTFFIILGCTVSGGHVRLFGRYFYFFLFIISNCRISDIRCSSNNNRNSNYRRPRRVAFICVYANAHATPQWVGSTQAQCILYYYLKQHQNPLICMRFEQKYIIMFGKLKLRWRFGRTVLKRVR